MAFLLICQYAFPVATSALDGQEPKQAGSQHSFQSAAMNALSEYKCDEAIILSLPDLHKAARLPLTERENKVRLARILTFIGRAFMFDENEPAAAQVLQMAYDLDPECSLTVSYLAETLWRLGRLNESDQLYAYLEKHCDGDTVAIEALLTRALRVSRFKDVKIYFAMADKLGDMNPLYLQSKANYLKSQGNISDSVDLLRTAYKLSASAYNKELLLALVEVTNGNQQEAVKHYRLAGKILPYEPSWHSKLGLSLTNLGTKDEALKQFEAVAYCRRFSSNSMSLLAEYLSFIGKKDEALKCLDYMEQVRPWSFIVHTVRGDVYKRASNTAGAVKEFQKAIALDPRKSLTYDYLVSIYLAGKQYDLAVKTMQKAVTFLPFSKVCWKRLGDAQSAQGRFAEAAAAYRQYFELTRIPELGQSDKHELASAHAALGTCYYKTNQMPEATNEAIEFNQLKHIRNPVKILSWVRLRPDRLNFKQPLSNTLIGQAVRHAALADMLYETGKLSECCKEYRKAIELDPGNVEWNMCLFSSLADKGDYGEAIKEDLILANKLMGKAVQTAGRLERKVVPPAENSHQ